MKVPSEPDASTRSSSSAVSGGTSTAIACPPSKEISMRTLSGIRHQLDQDAVHRGGMDERDLEAEQPLVRLAIDQLGSLALELVERGRQVLHPIGDMVHARASLGEELPHGRFGAERGEELD